MGYYEFGSNFSACPPQTTCPTPRTEPNPQIQTHPHALKQQSDAQQGRSRILGDPPGAMPEYVEEYLEPGFSALDDAMKAYWSGIRVPTKDAYRFMRVKVAGGDKTVLYWNDDLKNGRVRLPVASLNRGDHEYNPEKFSPPYLAMRHRYTSNRMDRVAKIYRPVPYLVHYTMSVWSAWKRDAEYILYQVLTRFNPMAEFTMYDGHIQGNVQLRFEGSADASEKEAGFDQRAKVRYEYRMVAEAWLPLPETIVPTVLGHANIVSELTSRMPILASRGNSGPTVRSAGG